MSEQVNLYWPDSTFTVSVELATSRKSHDLLLDARIWSWRLHSVSAFGSWLKLDSYEQGFYAIDESGHSESRDLFLRYRSIRHFQARRI